MTLAAIALIFATGCNKIEDGYYNPDKKISQVVNREASADKQSFDTLYLMNFVWSGQHLQQIDMEVDGHDYTIEKYLYDDENRLIKTYNYNYMFLLGEIESVYEYDGKFLKHIYTYDDDATDTVKYEFIYNRSTLEQITITGLDMTGDEKMLIASMGSFLSPEMATAIRMVETKIKSSPTKNIYETIMLYFEWSKGNISQLIAKTVDDKYYLKIDYTYDDYNNPFRGMYPLSGYNFHNKNNCTNLAYTISEDDNGTIRTENGTSEYEYLYKENWPVSRRLVSGENGSETNMSLSAIATYGTAYIMSVGPESVNQFLYYKYVE